MKDGRLRRLSTGGWSVVNEVMMRKSGRAATSHAMAVSNFTGKAKAKAQCITRAGTTFRLSAFRLLCVSHTATIHMIHCFWPTNGRTSVFSSRRAIASSHGHSSSFASTTVPLVVKARSRHSPLMENLFRHRRQYLVKPISIPGIPLAAMVP